MSVSQNRPDVYRSKSLITRKRRAEADKRLAAEFALRRIELQAKLDAIASAAKAARAPGEFPALQEVIDYGAELAELQADMADREYHASGMW